ncbi:ArsR family transcriptional regulator [Nocardia sp. GAS34]
MAGEPRSPLGEENGGDLAAAVELAESTVSHHLSQLRGLTSTTTATGSAD